jgi:hypothetical protein
MKAPGLPCHMSMHGFVLRAATTQIPVSVNGEEIDSVQQPARKHILIPVLLIAHDKFDRILSVTIEYSCDEV